MSWCEKHGVDYVLGLARNQRLERIIEDEMTQARAESERSGQPWRVFKDFDYQTRESWSRARRVVGKAEYLIDKPNARFVVTSLSIDAFSAQTLYEDEYCGRGDMENRIKEQKSFLFSDRTSAATMRANQLRLWFSSVAYLLMSALRRLGLEGTDLAHAQCERDPSEAFQDRRAHPGHGSQDLGIAFEQLPDGGAFRARVQQPRSRFALNRISSPPITGPPVARRIGVSEGVFLAVFHNQ